MKNKHEYELSKKYFLDLLTFKKKHFSVATSVYLNKEAWQGSTFFLGQYYLQEYLNLEMPHSKEFHREYLFHAEGTYLLVDE